MDAKESERVACWTAGIIPPYSPNHQNPNPVVTQLPHPAVVTQPLPPSDSTAPLNRHLSMHQSTNGLFTTFIPDTQIDSICYPAVVLQLQDSDFELPRIY
jgi:hypothetical protein